MFKYFRNSSQLFLQELFKENPNLIRQIKRCQGNLSEHNLGVIVTYWQYYSNMAASKTMFKH